MSELEHFGIDYLYPSIDLLKADLKRMRDSMPEKVRAWHESLSIDTPLPPPDCGFEQWADRWEIMSFYEQRMVRHPDRVDNAFHRGWSLFASRTQRRIAEAMVIAEASPESVLQLLFKVRMSIQAEALDGYLEHFFLATGMGAKPIFNWVKMIRDSLDVNAAYISDYDSKIHAVTNPLDHIGILAQLGVLTNMDSQTMLAELRIKDFVRHSRLSNRASERQMSFLELQREATLTQMLVRHTRSIQQSVEIEKKVNEGKVVPVAWKLDFMPEAEQIEDKSSLDADGGMAARVTPGIDAETEGH